MDPDEYRRLKQEIVKYTGTNLDINYVKHHFSDVLSIRDGIDVPRRRLHRIVHLEDLFVLLEDLDCLNTENTNYLKELGDVLSDQRILGLVKTYNKLRGLSDQQVCELCANDNNSNQSSGATYNTFYSRELHVSPHVEDSFSDLLKKRPNDLVQAINALSSKLKSLWPVVLRELELKEIDIIRVRKKFRNDFQKQAVTALNYWSITDCEASVKKLHEALSTDECRRRGLSPQLTKFEPYARMLI